MYKKKMKVSEELKRSQQQVREHVDDFFAGNVTLHLPGIPQYDEQGIEGYLNKVVEFCMVKYDREQGIDWYVENDSLIRDAREQGKIDLTKVDPWAWTGQFYNDCRAALLLLKFHDKEEKEAEEAIIDLMNEVGISDRHDKLTIKTKEDVEVYNRKLIDLMVSVTEEPAKTIHKQIKLALNCSGLDDMHYHITTIMDGPRTDSYMIESDIKMGGLNGALKEVFGKVVKVVKRDMLPDNDLYRWHRNQNSFDAFVARESCAKILNSNHIKIIPTQFRKLIPGLRNAYLEIASVWEGGYKELLKSYRSGVPAFGTDVALTKEAIKVFAEQTGSRDVYINSLLSGAEIGAAAVFTKVEKDQPAVHVIQTPVNMGRFKGGREVGGYSNVLGKIAATLPVDSEISDFIKKDRVAPGQIFTINSINKKIAAIDDPEIQNTVKNLVECRRLLNEKVSWRALGSSANYELAAKMSLALYDVQFGALSKYSTSEINGIGKVVFCKSGKDRTGITMRLAADLAFERYYGEDVHRITVNGGQQQTLAGINCSPLCLGLKSEKTSNMPKQYKGLGLSRRTADGNGVPTSKSPKMELLDIVVDGKYESLQNKGSDTASDISDHSSRASAADYAKYRPAVGRKPVPNPSYAQKFAPNRAPVRYGPEPSYYAPPADDAAADPYYNQQGPAPAANHAPPSGGGGGKMSNTEYAIGAGICLLLVLLFGWVGMIVAGAFALIALEGNNGGKQNYAPPPKMQAPHRERIVARAPEYSHNHAAKLQQQRDNPREDISRGA